MEELLKNSALVSLLGVAVGSMISFLSVMYSERIKLRTIEIQQKQARKDALERSFASFLHLVNQYRDFCVSRTIGFNNFMADEDAISLIKSAEKILAELDMRASRELSIACHKIYNKIFMSLFDSESYLEDYRNVVDLMKKEIKDL